ncbi:uncharacterized protein K452DRAFT_319362 [Aplosporella prunicola CBS 121167]|uniref:Uncharacterized protein n=1 Tax=Aplosporella prunicola CBS 121167 TaxID=1176127 RepID=A0A6A6BA19_9PEZI|nr:uncharacterized protein K452DRAFT_319362 [Aplosporella prunicola CBS 121167]KAF2141122.1 hypothetical protein K452DRAFT_319362 [Aplosporella prunicola CBS 121167]
MTVCSADYLHQVPNMAKETLVERAVVEWRNESGEACGLGCATPINDSDPSLMFTVFLEQGKVLALLRIAVTVKGGGRAKSRPFDLVIPLHTSHFERRSITLTGIQETSVRDAICKARLSRSGKLHRVQINLSEDTSKVITPHKNEGNFVATSDTALDLLSGLFCLAETREFVVYMGISNYADMGLAVLDAALREPLQFLPPEEFRTLYDGRSAMIATREMVKGTRRKQGKGTVPPRLSDNETPAYEKSPPPATTPPAYALSSQLHFVQVPDTPAATRFLRHVLSLPVSPGDSPVPESVPSEKGSLVSWDLGASQSSWPMPIFPDELEIENLANDCPVGSTPIGNSPVENHDGDHPFSNYPTEDHPVNDRIAEKQPNQDHLVEDHSAGHLSPECHSSKPPSEGLTVEDSYRMDRVSCTHSVSTSSIREPTDSLPPHSTPSTPLSQPARKRQRVFNRSRSVPSPTNAHHSSQVRLQHWLHLAIRRNSRVYEHPALQHLFTSFTHTPGTTDSALDAHIAHATAVIACDINGFLHLQQQQDNVGALAEAVADVEGLVSWAMSRSPNAELDLWHEFMQLGAAARESLNGGEEETEAYIGMKSGIVAGLMMTDAGVVTKRQ